MGGAFTLSKAALADHCIFPFTAKAPDWPRVELVPESRINRAFHWICARVINGEPVTDTNALLIQACKDHDLDPEKTKAKLAAMRPILHAMDYVERHRATAVAETALAYDWQTRTVRELGKDIGRHYTLGSTEIGSTVDAHATRDEPDLGFVLDVDDWKTGARARENVDPAPGNRQVGGLAMFLGKIIKADYISIGIDFISEDGYLWRDEYLADPKEDMEETEAWLQDLIARILRGGDPSPGAWCADKHCPLLGVCPETQVALAIVEQASKQDEVPQPVDDIGPAPMVVVNAEMIRSPAHALWARHRAKAAAKVCDQILAAVEAYTDKQPGGQIVLPNGKVFGPRKITTPHVECKGRKGLDTFLEAISEEIGEEKAVQLLIATIKGEDLKLAMGNDRLYKEAIQRLRKAGVVRDEVKFDYRERKPKE